MNNTISKCKSLSSNEKYKLKTIKPSAPRLRGQPKLHKVDIPIRPVVNFRSAPTYKMCKYLNEKIKNNLHFDLDLHVTNSYELIEKIQDITIPNNAIFMSFDVTNMYSNIPVIETLSILKENLIKN